MFIRYRVKLGVYSRPSRPRPPVRPILGSDLANRHKSEPTRLRGISLALFADRADRAEAQTTNGRLASKQAELEVAYTQIVERDPGVYTYPACIDARVSSSAIVGDLMVLSSVTTGAMESRASQCSKNLCIALVGKRIAALCL